MLSADAWDTVVDRLVETDFYRQEHLLIYQTMAGLRLRNHPLDAVTVSEELSSKAQLEAVGGLAYVVSLVERTPSAANIGAYADIVRERSVLRQLARIGEELSESAYESKGRLVQELLDQAEQKVFRIAEQGQRTQQGPRSVSTVLGHALARIQVLCDSKTPVTGLSTGFLDFDLMTTGLHGSDLIVLAGRPSMGKTTLAMNMVEHAVMKHDGVALVFSMEMPAEQLIIRLLSALGSIEQQKIRTGQLEEEDWPRVTSTVTQLAGKKLFIDDTGALSPMDVRARARRLVREHGRLDLIVIDYLQLMHIAGFSENRTAEISQISRSLKALARELNVPIVALSQLNRGLEQRNEKRPVMADLRESGAIEQDADLIVFVYRDEVYNKDSSDKGTAEIIIAKQRNGPIGVTRLTFVGHFSRFENFTAREIPHGPPFASAG